MQTVTAGSRTTTYSYDEAGNVIQIAYPSSTGYVSARTYDEAGRLTKITNEKPGVSVLSEFSYTLDAVGNPTQVAAPTGTTTYAYDELDRLTDVCYVSGCSGSGLAGITYTYDGVGNRLTEVRRSTSNTTTNYTYNDDDQLTQVGSHTYTYDDNGNQVSRGTRTFTYDLESRLVSSVQNNTRTYSYDGDGNRLTDTIGTAANDVRFVWDTNFSLPQFAIERDGNGTLQRSYTYGSGLLAESTNSTNAYYYLTDSIGSTANVIRHNGDVKWTYTYEPFGTLRSETSGSSAPLNLMRFAGERIDLNGDIYNLRARMYDPAAGRFFQEDPAPAAPGGALYGSYVYGNDRPDVLVDPSGRDAGGACVTIAFFFIIQWGGTTCILGTQGGDFGLAVTPALVGQTGVGLGSSATAGLMTSNADCLADLERVFTEVDAMGGAGPALSSSYAWGTASDGTPVFTSQAALGAGGGYAVGAGKSYTWTFGHRSTDCIALAQSSK